MKLEMIFIGAMAFALAFVLFLGVYGESLSAYNIAADTDSTFGKMSSNSKQIYDYQDNMKELIQGGTVTDESAVDEMVAGGYKGIRVNPFTALTVATNASMTLAQETGFLSPYIVDFLMIVLAILVIFAIIALIFRFRSN